MNARSNDRMPRARTNGLVVRKLTDEVLVYDRERDKAHCLNMTAALVWEQCDGQSTVADALRAIQEQAGAPLREEVVWYALAQLGKHHLLEERIDRPSLMTRQQMIRTLGIAALAVPVVSSLVVPTAAAAASCMPKSSTGCGSCAQCCSSHPSIPPCKPIFGSGCCKSVGRQTVCGTINAEGKCA